MTEEMSREEIWGAGFLSNSGSFALLKLNGRNKYQLRLRLTLQSSQGNDALWRFAALVGKTPSKSAVKKWIFVLEGEPLDRLMKRLWPELSNFQKERYTSLQAEAREMRAAVIEIQREAGVEELSYMESKARIAAKNLEDKLEAKGRALGDTEAMGRAEENTSDERSTGLSERAQMLKYTAEKAMKRRNQRMAG